MQACILPDVAERTDVLLLININLITLIFNNGFVFLVQTQLNSFTVLIFSPFNCASSLVKIIFQISLDIQKTNRNWPLLRLLNVFSVSTKIFRILCSICVLQGNTYSKGLRKSLTSIFHFVSNVDTKVQNLEVFLGKSSKLVPALRLKEIRLGLKKIGK